jgi:hypothetical protein
LVSFFLSKLKKNITIFCFSQKLSAAKEFGTLLGASFDNDTLTDIIRIMSKYFIKHETPVAHILKTMAKNEEFKIIKFWMTATDKKGKCFPDFENGVYIFFPFFAVIADLLDYMQKSSVDATEIATIKKVYLT